MKAKGAAVCIALGACAAIASPAGLASGKRAGAGSTPPDWPGVESPARAQTNYALNCQGCHLPDGRGAPPRVPDMQGVVSRFLAAPGGREYLVRVPGMTNAAVSNEELAELANWMLYRFDPQNIPADFTPYSAREVAENRRRSYTSEAAFVRERLLQSLDAAGERRRDTPLSPALSGSKP